MTADPNRSIIILDTSVLGSVVRNADNVPVGLELFSNVASLLARWQSHARIGATIDANASDKNPLPSLLRANGVLDFFERDLLVPSSRLPPADGAAVTSVFASAGRTERSAAMHAGYRVVPHLALVDEALAGEPLYYAQLRAKRLYRAIDDVVRDLPIAPVYRPTTERNTLYVITSGRTLDRLRTLGPDAMWVKEYQHFTDAPQGVPAYTDLFFVHECLDASQESAVFRDSVKKKVKIWWRLDDGLVLALDAAQAIDDFHPPHGGCGRVRLFVPTRAVIHEPEIRHTEAALIARPAEQLRALSPAAQTIIAGLDAKMIDDHWRCWVGKAPLPTGGPPIVSRYVNHPDNLRAVDGLVTMLTGITGNPARKLDIRSHSRWYNVEGIVRGTSSREFVAVSAHLDAIALDSAKVAPGGDDDASGMAAVLAIAATMRQLATQLGKPKRDIRFLLFNAEELYMIGSNDYAVALTRKTTASVPVALIQLDMVGVPSSLAPTRTWEIHPPGPDDYRTTLSPSARSRCLAIADLIEHCGNADPKHYKIDSPVKNGAKQDPLARRSDHSSFLLYGFPACAVTEDAFGIAANTDPAFARRYHRKADLTIDPEYTATIARAVASALWLLANDDGAPTSATTVTTPTASLTSTTEGESLIMSKTIMELIQDFADSQSVRAPILKNHVIGLEGYGVSEEAKTALGSMDLTEIVPVLLTELTDLDINAAKDLVDALARKKAEVQPAPAEPESVARTEVRPASRSIEALALAAGAYSAFGIHIFEVSVVNGGPIQLNQETTFTIRGNGYDFGSLLPEVRFVRPDQGELSDNIAAIVDSVRADVDLSEYVTARVTLNKSGSWWVHIKNNDSDWATDHRDMNKIIVP